jgi:phosphoribosylaminoimidazolecarboxamide formyltransferase / IMP cyclohydrolase
MRTVLVSVSDKSGLESFLRRLERFDELRLIATGNTHKFLVEHGFKCLKVEELTQFPEILAGRVKTLHPKVFAGILSRPSEEDRSCLAQHDIQEIDVVVVNLYPFEKKLSENLSEAEMVEQIDIGGVTLLRAAAKNFARVSIVSDPSQYDRIVESLEVNKGRFTDALRKNLAYAAFKRTADYDRSISSYLGRTADSAASGSVDESGESQMLPQVEFKLNKHQDLRYGENPHQSAAWYYPADLNPSLCATFPPFEQLQGKELSANNIVDVASLIKILRDLGTSGAVIIKHNNPSGVAIDKDLFKAFEKAYNCDPISAFGGIYGFTEGVNGKLAERITENFVEVVLAPSFDQAALTAFAKKKNVRVLRIKPEIFDRTFKPTLRVKDLQEMGYIVERDMDPPAAFDKFRCVTESKLDLKVYEADVEFAWNVVRHLTSNAIFVARNGLSLGFGIGQTNRVASVRLAVEQAGKDAKGAVLASDAFFPATDNIETAAAAGIKVIVQPGGSLKDEDVIAACNKHGIVMLFTGQRCFKH